MMIVQYLAEKQLFIWKSGIWGCKNKIQNIEKMAFNVVQMKF